MSKPSLAPRIEQLESVLRSSEPLGPATDIPFAIFVYEPSRELELRKEVELLSTRLKNAGHPVHVVDLGKIMWDCVRAHPGGPDGLVEVEKGGADLDDVLAEARTLLIGPRQDRVGPLERRVIEELSELDESDGIGLLVQAGALFPIYRTSALLERMIGVLQVRTVLFYPGLVRGASELSFMGVCEPSPNYRPRIFAS